MSGRMSRAAYALGWGVGIIAGLTLVGAILALVGLGVGALLGLVNRTNPWLILAVVPMLGVVAVALSALGMVAARAAEREGRVE